MFRYKTSVPLPYDRQGYIYFWLLNYPLLPQRQQERIRRVCREVGGEDYAAALQEFLTTDRGGTAVCMAHHLSRSTLWRYVRRAYVRFDREI